MDLVRLNTASPPSAISRVKKICIQAFSRESVASQISTSPTSFLPSSYAAILDEEVVGYVCLKKYNQAKSENGGECRSAVLHTICVDEVTRGKGIGGAIVLALKELAIKNSLHYLLLAAALGPNQSRLVTFYSRYNFRVIPDTEGASNMGEGLSKKISEEALSGLSALLMLRSGSSIDEVTSTSSAKWMKCRLVSRSPLPVDHSSLFSSQKSSNFGSLHFKLLNGSGLTPELQVGPSCGIAALYMCLSLHSLPSYPVTCDLLSVAISNNLTRDGEFFDVDNLKKLIMVSPVSDKFRKVEVKHFPDLTVIYNIINSNKGCILTPFDVLGNGVTCRSGNSSHWGVVAGYEEGGEKVYVQHSQSLGGFVCEYKELKESNAQLNTCGRKYCDYVEEVGGMNLKGQCIYLYV
ncbi:hypothetical protein TrST_g10772 [Triparma strigata]|uniref:Actin maturation protease n=1 Tax=Triparma strigata TaxID=1606541 RepID=A0A9W7F215_9STRA|nr:hypothetical protein TrST_g10772 [Triparma strigata]